MLTVQHNCHFYRVGASGHVGGLNTYYFSLSDIPESVAKIATSIAAFQKNKKVARCEGAQLKQTFVTVQVGEHLNLVRNIDSGHAPKRRGGITPDSNYSHLFVSYSDVYP